MKTLITIILTFCLVAVYGQSSKAIEQDLLTQFKLITYWSGFNGDDEKIDKYDSLEKVNEEFEKKLLRYTSKYTETIVLDFKNLEEEGLTIATSDDKLFRIYSWDTETGGTMHVFKNIYQYKIGSKVFSKTKLDPNAEGDPGVWYSKICTLKSSGKTYYLSINHGIFSTRDTYQGIKIFSLTNSSLNDTVKLIKTKTGLRNALGFEFDFFSVVNAEERPAKLIHYNVESKTITIPVVLEDGTVTKKSIHYRFTGQYFERKK